jgi:hypothetical protein
MSRGTKEGKKAPTTTLNPDDYFDSIHEVRERVTPLLTLMSHSVELNPKGGDILTNKDISGLGLLLKDLLDDVFVSVDGLYEICKKRQLEGQKN